MGLIGFLRLFDNIVYLYEPVFSDSGSAACGHLSFRLLRPSGPAKSLISFKKRHTICVVDIAVNSVAHLIHFNLKKWAPTISARDLTTPPF